MYPPKVRQALFEMISADGTVWSFAILEDQRCAIIRDGEIADIRDSDEASLGRAVKEYFAHLEACGGSRPPFETFEPPSHPHAG